MKSYSIGEARDSFAAIVHEAERGSALELTRRGKPVAVLLSVEEYRRLSGNKKGFWEAYSDFREGKDLEQLNIRPEVFEGLRDASPGRATAWRG
ncbi:MAG: type II toxin-antitoxin system Phd/YefM family antitoxin [Actinomycetota bacterium]|nr:type II toxin-antitoxin system Phd/YefM family antitoxin [Actinomycetota bacterium]